VALCKAALEAASLNVFINTMSMTDRAHAERVNGQANALLDVAIPQAEAIFADIAERFRK
jgi:formiminotetrahydrofolate cyclodeaminase